jgi:large subunit ribosomal protein L2
MGKRTGSRRRGSSPRYRAPSHRYKAKVRHIKKSEAQGVVSTLFHDPGHTAPIAKVKLDSGEKVDMIAHESMRVGQDISVGVNVPLKAGNSLPIGNIPEGTTIYNVENRPRDGGKFARSGGTNALVVSHGEKTVIQLPSRRFVPLDNHCMATIGLVAGGGQPVKMVAKAGRMSNYLRSKARRYPKVSGTAMNPVDHPHGGGAHQHVGKPTTVSRHSRPGRKVGSFAAKRTGKRTGKRS